MSPHKRFAGCVVEVALHEEVEEVGGIAADGAQLGVAALEDLVAEGGAHVGAAFEERAGKLRRGGGEMRAQRAAHGGVAPQSSVPQPSTHLVNEGAQRGEDLLERRL